MHRAGKASKTRQMPNTPWGPEPQSHSHSNGTHRLNNKQQFCAYFISGSRHFCPGTISSGYHFISVPFCPGTILSGYHFIMVPFYQGTILSGYHFIRVQGVPKKIVTRFASIFLCHFLYVILKIHSLWLF